MTATGSPAAQPLYDARSGVYYAKPVLRGWLHLLCFGVSLVSGPLLLAGVHGAARITAVAVYSASVSGLFGMSALYHRGSFGLACLIVMWALTLTAAAIHLAWMNAPELLVGGTFVGLGWVAGLSLIWVWIHAGVAAGVLMLAGGLLYTAGALFYHRRWPNPFPSCSGTTRAFMPTLPSPRPASMSR